MLYSEDGNILLTINETIYTIESSQGEPYYYIGRIVKFEVLDEYSNLIKSLMEITTFFPAKYFNLRMNWFYRISDMLGDARISDPRNIYATQL